jgi:hypothetical protein
VPLTPAHTAAAWPLSRILPRLPLDALVLGAMLPDFEYLLHLAPRGQFAHSPLGLLLFCLPVGLLTWAIYRHVVRPAALTLLPPGLRSGLVAPPSGLFLVIAAVLLGAASHILWDSFTHGHGWAVRHIPALSTSVQLFGLGNLRIYKILQHGSTIVGLAAVAVWVGGWIRGQPSSARSYTDGSGFRAVRILAMLLAAGAAGAVLNGLRGMHRGLGAGLGHAAVGGMAALGIAVVVFGFVTRPRQGPGAAT